MKDLPLYYKNVFDNLNGLVTTKDLNSTIIYVNDDVLKTLNIDKKDIINKKYSDFDFISESTAERLKEQDRYVIENKKAIKDLNGTTLLK